jgi:elongator complex protein 3
MSLNFDDRQSQKVKQRAQQEPDPPNMATMTMTETQQKRRLPKNVKLPPENERYMRACADIASALIQDYESQADGSKPKKDLNLNHLRGQISKKHYLKSQPPLTAIIAAVPEHYKKYILPKLIAKPIRMSSRQTYMQVTQDD